MTPLFLLLVPLLVGGAYPAPGEFRVATAVPPWVVLGPVGRPPPVTVLPLDLVPDPLRPRLRLEPLERVPLQPSASRAKPRALLESVARVRAHQHLQRVPVPPHREGLYRVLPAPAVAPRRLALFQPQEQKVPVRLPKMGVEALGEEPEPVAPAKVRVRAVAGAVPEE